MGIKPAEKPVDWATWAASLVNALIAFPVVFGWWHPTAEQLSLVTLIANLLVQGASWRFLKRFTTDRADPKTVDGTPLQPVARRTRGIPKG